MLVGDGLVLNEACVKTPPALGFQGRGGCGEEVAWFAHVLCVPGTGEHTVLLRGTITYLKGTAVTLGVAVLTCRCTSSDGPLPSCQDIEHM